MSNPYHHGVVSADLDTVCFAGPTHMFGFDSAVVMVDTCAGDHKSTW